MRTNQLLAFLGAATISSLALAEPAAPVSVQADGNTVTVNGGPGQVSRLAPGQADALRGAFRLEDGRLLRLSSHMNKLYMEMDGKREQLLPLSGNEFVASRSGARVELDNEAYASRITLTQSR